MSRRFERFTANAEAWMVGGALAVLAIVYLITNIRG